jgi:NADPH-dependent 2,4-dienoyl-CoA reductase/sulfur reductase-like enzyme
VTSLRTLVVVGGSLAGLRAVEALRRRGYEGRIVWIGEEAVPPYDRPPLSKQLLDGTWPPERLQFRRGEGYDALEVEQRFGRRATRLDATRREVWLDDGDRVGWDGLIIATGASPRHIPATKGLAGVHVLRTLDEALAIRDALAAGPRVTILGAGFIGLEVAASCRKRGAAVTVIEVADVPLSRAIGPDIGSALAAIHRDEGVDLRTGVRVTDFVGDGRIEAVVLQDWSRI